MALHLTCAFEVITLPNERVIALSHHFFSQFLHIVEIGQKAHNATTSRPPVQCILQILTTFNLYSGRPRVGLSVNNKQKVRQAMDKISGGGGWLDHRRVKSDYSFSFRKLGYDKSGTACL